LIHDEVAQTHLKTHPDPTRIEYYLCGPTVMVQAATKMLEELKVSKSRIAFDEF
jgi:Na+-transporting NADH:ubiquinone oxidoreductase subunit F